MSASDLERRLADNLAEKVNRAIASGRQMHLDDDGWYVDDTTGELIGPDSRMERPLTEKDSERGDIYEGEKLIRRGGRPKSSDPKKLTALRLDSDLLAQLKSSGPGWQTRVNAMLRRAAKLDINLRVRMRAPYQIWLDEGEPEGRGEEPREGTGKLSEAEDAGNEAFQQP
jgi:uncharacterized protein (DUF4415 family)